MDDGFQPREGDRIADDAPAEAHPVDGAVDGHAGKGRLDGGHGGPARRIEGVDGMVGVEDGNAGAGEHRRRRRLAHAERTGEAEDEHHPASIDLLDGGARAPASPSGACRTSG